MNRVTKFALAAITVSMLSSIPALANGVFGFGVELTGSGVLALNSGVTTLYALNNSGGSRLLPNGSSATLNTAWTNSSNDSSPTFSLGTFDVSARDTLTLPLNGASILTFGGGENGNGQYLNYSVVAIGSGDSFVPGINLPQNQVNVNGNNNDNRYSTESANVPLLTGLPDGTYKLSVYGFAANDVGSINNGGANYIPPPLP